MTSKVGRGARFVLCLLGSVLVVGAFVHASFAQTAASTEAMIAQRKAQLEAELANLERLIAEQQQLLNGKQGERVTLERDLTILNAQIKKAKLAIRAQEAMIADLEQEIFSKEATIQELTEKIDMEKESIAALIRRIAEIDDMSIAEVLFSGDSISQCLEEVDRFLTINQALQASYQEFESLRSSNKDAKENLENKQETEQELRSLRLLQQEKLKTQETEKTKILRVTKGEEQRYQQLIKQNQRTAAQIRSELFELRGSSAINLGDAIEFATFAGSRTGIRPALVLGVLKQETSLGANLGNGTWSADMHPTRDRPLFKVITSTLGLNPDTMPVSAKPGYGWGGAMGPAQFIPSTWACYGGYVNTLTGGCNNRLSTMSWDQFWAGPWTYDASEDRLRVVRGKQSPSNPWDNQDAFIAAAILMKDNGADAGTPGAERMAALRYFAGSNATNPAYAFYGDGVMGHAEYYQKQIDTLKELAQ